jgi:hypothetical protein
MKFVHLLFAFICLSIISSSRLLQVFHIFRYALLYPTIIRFLKGMEQEALFFTAMMVGNNLKQRRSCSQLE